MSNCLFRLCRTFVRNRRVVWNHLQGFLHKLLTHKKPLYQRWIHSKSYSKRNTEHNPPGVYGGSDKAVSLPRGARVSPFTVDIFGYLMFFILATLALDIFWYFIKHNFREDWITRWIGAKFKKTIDRDEMSEMRVEKKCYTVLLSYPNENSENEVKLLDDQNNEIEVQRSNEPGA